MADEWDYNEDIAEGMARGLWLAAYSSFAEEANDPDFPRARQGQDWDDVAPETPEIADEAALALAKLYVDANHVTLDGLYGRATLANGQDEDDSDQAYMFGFYLSQMAIGSGLSWFDDHARFDLKKPFFFEVDFDGEYLTWSGGTGPIVTNPPSVMTGPGWSSAREKLRSAAAKKNPDDKVFKLGDRVAITAAGDDTNVVAEGVVLRLASKGWIGIELDGESRVDEYPVERVWRVRENPRLFHHPEDPHALRPSEGARKTLKYPILPGPKHGPTPRVRRAPKRGKKNPASEDLRFPLICKKCLRAITKTTLDGTYIDAVELSEKCPAGGMHEATITAEKKNPYTARLPGRR